MLASRLAQDIPDSEFKSLVALSSDILARLRVCKTIFIALEIQAPNVALSMIK